MEGGLIFCRFITKKFLIVSYKNYQFGYYVVIKSNIFIYILEVLLNSLQIRINSDSYHRQFESYRKNIQQCTKINRNFPKIGLQIIDYCHFHRIDYMKLYTSVKVIESAIQSQQLSISVATGSCVRVHHVMLCIIHLKVTFLIHTCKSIGYGINYR